MLGSCEVVPLRSFEHSAQLMPCRGSNSGLHKLLSKFCLVPIGTRTIYYGLFLCTYRVVMDMVGLNTLHSEKW